MHQLSSKNLFYNPKRKIAIQALNEYYPNKHSIDSRNNSIKSNSDTGTSKLKSILSGTVKPLQPLLSKKSFNTSNNSSSGSFQKLMQTNISTTSKSQQKPIQSKSIGKSPKQLRKYSKIITSPKTKSSLNQNQIELYNILKNPRKQPLNVGSQNQSCASLTERFNRANNSINDFKIQQAQKIIQTLKTDIQKNVKSLSSPKKDIISQAPQLPLSGQDSLRKYEQYLTESEKIEILEYESIYFLGHQAKKQDKQYDNEKGDYKFNIRDHIGFRYEMLEKLGKGSFGQVFRVYDYKRKTECALKIIKNKKRFHYQALVEISILKELKSSDNLVKMKDYFLFRDHVCIIFELLSINLYDFLRKNCFMGVNLDLIRRFAIQILQGLLVLQNKQIIHCDLKPENILLKEKNKSGLKIIDFGSSCFSDNKMYTYIQSRFYRSPEILLGLPYNCSIDWWSFGCILVELYIGQPLFPSESEKDHLWRIMEVLGNIPKNMAEKSEKLDTLLDDQCTFTKTKTGEIRFVGSKPIEYILQNCPSLFIDFVRGFLKWESNKRLDPASGLVHPWILEGLPNSIKFQHLKQMKGLAPHLSIFTNIMHQDYFSSSLEENNSNENPSPVQKQGQGAQVDQKKQQKSKKQLEQRILTLQQLLNTKSRQ